MPWHPYTLELPGKGLPDRSCLVYFVAQPLVQLPAEEKPSGKPVLLGWRRHTNQRLASTGCTCYKTIINLFIVCQSLLEAKRREDGKLCVKE
jgi:hypothetical protein